VVVVTFGGTVVLAAVDPVPWGRAQMAFTLMFHIVLVPLGVSWAFMTLIANYRAVKHGDRDALVLALTIHGDLAGVRVGTEKGAPDLGE
jgi:cytochrome d ubiquinol oxidase subunit I